VFENVIAASVRELNYNFIIIIFSFTPLPMETKSARFTVLLDPVKKKAFEELCAAQDLTPSQVVRSLMREYLERHGVDYSTKNRIKSTATGVD
jgi:hypothetical protein